MSPLLVTGLLCVACVLASPLDTWTQASPPTKHAAQVSIVSIPSSNIHHHQRLECWELVLWCCIWFLYSNFVLDINDEHEEKNRPDKILINILNNKKAFVLKLMTVSVRDKTFTRIHTRAWFTVYIVASIKVHKINCSQNHIWQPKAGGKDILSRGYVPTYGNDASMVFSPEVWHLHFAPNGRASGLTSPLDGSILVVKSP